MRKFAIITLVSTVALAGCTDEDTRLAASLLLAAADGYAAGSNPNYKSIYKPTYTQQSRRTSAGGGIK